MLTTSERQCIDQYLDGMVTIDELCNMLRISFDTAYTGIALRMGEKQKVRKYINLYRADRLSI